MPDPHTHPASAGDRPSVLAMTPQLADALIPIRCLFSTDDLTGCPNPAAYRIAWDPIPGYDDGPVTYACTHHTAELRARRTDLAEVRPCDETPASDMTHSE